MAYPPAYTRAFSFTDWETLHPGEPKPGSQLDTEYDNVSNAITGTQAALALIQRADGKLANASVGEDQLEPGIFDGIADGITDEAQAAADAASASASAAATSAASASSNAALAVTSRNEAAGFATQAGVSQGIAQSAGSDAAALADDAADSAAAAANSANEAQGFRNEAEGHEQLAFDWAEKLEGPVEPAPPGWPEAVDDGMFSSKWWAIRARDYNETSTLDFGTTGTDIGNAFVIWDAIPGNELPLGQVYATWGSPVQTYVLTDHDHPEDPASWTNITGGPGPPNILSVGTVITGAPGSVAAISITGTSPAQVLNMSIPRGDVGATGGVGPTGPAGPPNALAVGTVTTGAAGSAAVVTITGTSPTQTINFTIPKGDQGIQGIQGIQGPVGPAGPSVPLADPTGTIGLTPVVGTALTAIRSDAAPALSQAIVPTWTGTHTFNNPSAGASTLQLFQLAGTPAGRFGVEGTAGSIITGSVVGDFVAANLLPGSGFVVGNIANGRTVINAHPGALSFGNATDNPTYNFLGTGAGTVNGPWTFNGATSTPVTINGVSGDWALQVKGAGALPYGQLITAGDNSGASALFVRRADAGNRPLLNVTGTAIALGNATDNPAYNFLGTGFSTFNGAVFIQVPNAQPLALDSSNANGPYIAFKRSGTTFGYVGNSGTNLFSPGQLDGIGIASNYILFGSQTGTEWARFNGGLQITGAVAAPFKAAAGLELGVSGGTLASVGGYNRNTGDYIPLQFYGTNYQFNPRFGNTSIWMGGRRAFDDLSDGWLRLNNSLDYTGGVYSPGVIQCGTGFYSNGGLSAGGAGTPRIRPNLTGTGGLSYGSVNVDGATNGYMGYGINDGATLPLFMSNGTIYGIYGQTDGKWLLRRADSSQAQCDFNLLAPVFQVTSSRTIKRETGRLTRAADILSKLRPILYRLLIGDDREQLGLIAEEVHEVCPQLSDGKSVMYDRLALLLLADWQESHQLA